MSNPVFSNIAIYKSIAEEAHDEMTRFIVSSRHPKPDGSKGWVITYDPDHKSFKQAMISIVFTGMWLEALMHLRITKNYGKEKFNEYDFKSYEEKLKLLGIEDAELLKSVTRFRKARKNLVHEKAHLDDGEVQFAQREADNARNIISEIQKQLSK